MQSNRRLILFVTAFMVTTVPLFGTSRETVLYDFQDNNYDGNQPMSTLIANAAGILYGTTSGGGISGCNGSGCGTVFELTPGAGGKWTETVLYSFTGGGDGAAPGGALIFDANGNLYGTTGAGGASGWGTVFELTPVAKDKWVERVLHSFSNNGKDGVDPNGGLMFDTAGNLYGTTSFGGIYGYGTAFELTPVADVRWTEKVLHSFNSNGKDGYEPKGGLVLDPAGSLYGTTIYGGAFSEGTVFQLSPETGGVWKETVLHDFCAKSVCPDGFWPAAGLVFDTAGNLYGTTEYGGAYYKHTYSYGTVFQLTRGTNGQWTETVLHSFRQYHRGGQVPQAALILDTSGNLYGTAGGGYHGGGVAFQLMPGLGGKWTENVLYSFCAKSGCTDGNGLAGGLLLDAAGNLYGTTINGGTGKGCNGLACGTVFEITP
jgi:uncharacterized repeat protein (TIGR03803 family)